MNFVVIDIETNGVNPENDDLLLLSATKICDGEITDTFSKLVKPSRSQTDELELFTGITNKELESADSIENVISDFQKFSKGCTIVSYDDFEVYFLENKGIKIAKVIYLREYIRNTYPDLGKYIADAVVVSLGLEEMVKNHISTPLYYGKSRLFYSLKVAAIFMSVIENFITE